MERRKPVGGRAVYICILEVLRDTAFGISVVPVTYRSKHFDDDIHHFDGGRRLDGWHGGVSVDSSTEDTAMIRWQTGF